MKRREHHDTERETKREEKGGRNDKIKRWMRILRELQPKACAYVTHPDNIAVGVLQDDARIIKPKKTGEGRETNREKEKERYRDKDNTSGAQLLILHVRDPP